MTDPTLKECWTLTHMGPCGENCITNLLVDELIYLLRLKTYNKPELREEAINAIRAS